MHWTDGKPRLRSRRRDGLLIVDAPKEIVVGTLANGASSVDAVSEIRA